MGFYGLPGLSSVTISDEVKDVGCDAFLNCPILIQKSIVKEQGCIRKRSSSAPELICSNECQQKGFSARVQLGIRYYTGLGMKQDYAEAVKCFREAAEAGCPSAQLWLGACYFFSKGVEKDKEMSFEWLHKAAERGDVSAQYWLGVHRLLFRALYTPEENETSFHWLREAAEQGNSGAQYWVGYCYYNGIYTDKNYNEAVNWLRKAMAQKKPEAQYLLGKCCYYGYGSLTRYHKVTLESPQSRRASSLTGWKEVPAVR